MRCLRSWLTYSGVLLFGLLAACGGGCGCSDAPASPLDAFPRTTITLDGQPLEVWVAANASLRAQGLMHIEAAALAPQPDGTPRGMLFVFPTDAPRSFWMKDTPAALELAYAERGGTVTSLHAMVPHSTQPVPSGVPAGLALEALDGTLTRMGAAVGSQLVVPAQVLAGATP